MTVLLEYTEEVEEGLIAWSHSLAVGNWWLSNLERCALWSFVPLVCTSVQDS